LARRAIFLLVLLAVAACGDDNNAFKQDYNEAVRPLSVLGDDVGESLTRAAGESNEELATRYDNLAERLDEVRDNLSGLEPPDDVAPQFDELLAALGEGSKRLRALADVAEEGKPAEAREATGALIESGRRLREAERAFREAVED
jgi:hypothetical protein